MFWQFSGSVDSGTTLSATIGTGTTAATTLGTTMSPGTTGIPLSVVGCGYKQYVCFLASLSASVLWLATSTIRILFCLGKNISFSFSHVWGNTTCLSQWLGVKQSLTLAKDLVIRPSSIIERLVLCETSNSFLVLWFQGPLCLQQSVQGQPLLPR
jgi:hypothetical protein